MQPVSRDTQTAYKWDEGGVGWPLVDTHGLLVIEETLAPGCSETRHHHNKAVQCFYILDGTALMEFDGQSVILDKGMCLHIQPGSDHTIANNSSIDTRFLVMSAPSTRSDRQESTVKK
jgi:mannose-6-phosphate isomerase-like protein (cupin superfamily)